MKIPRIKRDVALLFSICSLAIIPLILVVRSRGTIPDDVALIYSEDGVSGMGGSADISPDGTLIAVVEPSSRDRRITSDGLIYYDYDLVVRPLTDGRKQDDQAIKSRTLIGDDFRRVTWSSDGKSISTWGKTADLYDFSTNVSPTTETQGTDAGGQEFSSVVLPLRSMAEFKDGYYDGPAWILPESDYIIGRNRTGTWVASEISTQRGISINMPRTNPMAPISNSFQRFAARPVSVSHDAGKLVSVQITEVLAEPTPTPTPYPTPTAKQILEAKEANRKANYAAALSHQLAVIEWQLDPEKTPDEKERADIEARVNAIKKELEDYAPYGYDTPINSGFPPPVSPDFNMPTSTSLSPVYANVKLKEVVDGRTFWTHRVRYNSKVPLPVWSNDGSLVALIGDYDKQVQEGNIKILDGKNGRIISEFTLSSERIHRERVRFFRSVKGSWSLMIPDYNAPDSAFRFFDVRTGKLTALWAFSDIKKLRINPAIWACNQSGEVWAFTSSEPDLWNEKYNVLELKWVKMTRKQLDKRLGTSGPKS